MKDDYLIVHKGALPDYFEKVLQARRLLTGGEEKDVSSAVRRVGISRSTYYKYKDSVFGAESGEMGRKAVISMVLTHEIGVLSTALKCLSSLNVNVLTISQSMPIRGRAGVTMSLDLAQMDGSPDDAIHALEQIEGVENVNLVAVE